MSSRKYSGAPVDGTVQYLGEAPHWQGDGETVDVTPDDSGQITTEGVPDVGGVERPDVEGQSTWADWGGDQR